MVHETQQVVFSNSAFGQPFFNSSNFTALTKKCSATITKAKHRNQITIECGAVPRCLTVDDTMGRDAKR